jgi:glycerophosphoryl diester phosphodiesterase
MDLHLSRDGVPVVIHDPTLDRTTDATGPVAGRTAAELARVDAGARFTVDGGRTYPYRGQGIGVPRLEEVLAAHPAMPLILEIKAPEAAGPVLALLERMDATRRVLIGSFHDEALRAFSDARIPVAGATHALAKLYLPALFGSRRTPLAFQAMCIPRFYRGLPLPVAGFARLMAANGGPVHVWTVNDRAEARALWSAGVAGIISDDPAAMIAERARLA